MIPKKYLRPLILGFGVMLWCGACRQPIQERKICAIEQSQTVFPQPSTQVLTWELNVTQSQQLTARLLIANNGRLKTTTEIDYRWQDWAKTTTANGQVILLLQDGKPFGVQDKQLPLLSVNFLQAPPHRKTEKRHFTSWRIAASSCNEFDDQSNSASTRKCSLCSSVHS